jgi:hypothetical protein
LPEEKLSSLCALTALCAKSTTGEHSDKHATTGDKDRRATGWPHIEKALNLTTGTMDLLVSCARMDEPSVTSNLQIVLQDESTLDSRVVAGLVSIAHGEVAGIEDLAALVNVDPAIAEGLVLVSAADGPEFRGSQSVRTLLGSLGLDVSVMEAVLALNKIDMEGASEISEALSSEIRLPAEILRGLMCVCRETGLTEVGHHVQRMGKAVELDDADKVKLLAQFAHGDMDAIEKATQEKLAVYLPRDSHDEVLKALTLLAHPRNLARGQVLGDAGLKSRNLAAVVDVLHKPLNFSKWTLGKLIAFGKYERSSASMVAQIISLIPKDRLLDARAGHFSPETTCPDAYVTTPGFDPSVMRRAKAMLRVVTEKPGKTNTAVKSPVTQDDIDAMDGAASATSKPRAMSAHALISLDLDTDEDELSDAKMWSLFYEKFMPNLLFLQELGKAGDAVALKAVGESTAEDEDKHDTYLTGLLQLLIPGSEGSGSPHVSEAEYKAVLGPFEDVTHPGTDQLKSMNFHVPAAYEKARYLWQLCSISDAYDHEFMGTFKAAGPLIKLMVEKDISWPPHEQDAEHISQFIDIAELLLSLVMNEFSTFLAKHSFDKTRTDETEGRLESILPDKFEERPASAGTFLQALFVEGDQVRLKEILPGIEFFCCLAHNGAGAWDKPVVTEAVLRRLFDEDCVLDKEGKRAVLKAITAVIKDDDPRQTYQLFPALAKHLTLDLSVSKALTTLSMGNVDTQDLYSAVDVIAEQLGLNSGLVRAFCVGQLKTPRHKLAQALAPFARKVKADENLLACILKISFWDTGDADMDPDEQIGAVVNLVAQFLPSSSVASTGGDITVHGVEVDEDALFSNVAHVAELASGDDDAKIRNARKQLCKALAVPDVHTELKKRGTYCVEVAAGIARGNSALLRPLIEVLEFADSTDFVTAMLHLFIDDIDQPEDFKAIESQFSDFGKCPGLLQAMFAAVTKNPQAMTNGIQEAMQAQQGSDGTHARSKYPAVLKALSDSPGTESAVWAERKPDFVMMLGDCGLVCEVDDDTYSFVENVLVKKGIVGMEPAFLSRVLGGASSPGAENACSALLSMIKKDMMKPEMGAVFTQFGEQVRSSSQARCAEAAAAAAGQDMSDENTWVAATPANIGSILRLLDRDNTADWKLIEGSFHNVSGKAKRLIHAVHRFAFAASRTSARQVEGPSGVAEGAEAVADVHAPARALRKEEAVEILLGFAMQDNLRIISTPEKKEELLKMLTELVEAIVSLIERKERGYGLLSDLLDIPRKIIRGFACLTVGDMVGARHLGEYVGDYDDKKCRALMLITKKIAPLVQDVHGAPSSGTLDEQAQEMAKPKHGEATVTEVGPERNDDGDLINPAELFNRLDTDNTGKLDQGEFADLVAFYQLNPTKHQVASSPPASCCNERQTLIITGHCPLWHLPILPGR